MATILYLFLVYQFSFVCNDAYLSFQDSKNLTVGLGLTSNINGQIPIERYSNFLVIIIGVGIKYLGLKIDFWNTIFSTLTGLALLRVLYLFIQELGLPQKRYFDPKDTLGAAVIGNLAYFLQMLNYGRFGLLEPRATKRQIHNLKSNSADQDQAVPAEFFLSDRPSFIKADQDYMPKYYPLERQLSRMNLGLLVLKR